MAILGTIFGLVGRFAGKVLRPRPRGEDAGRASGVGRRVDDAAGRRRQADESPTPADRVATIAVAALLAGDVLAFAWQRLAPPAQRRR